MLSKPEPAAAGHPALFFQLIPNTTFLNSLTPAITTFTYPAHSPQIEMSPAGNLLLHHCCLIGRGSIGRHECDSLRSFLPFPALEPAG
jgi:hypothetical protein